MQFSDTGLSDCTPTTTWLHFWLERALEACSNLVSRVCLISFNPSPGEPQCCGLPWRVWRASEVMNTGKTRVLRQNRHYASCSKERFRVYTDTTILVTQDINHSLCRNVTYMKGGKNKILSVEWLGPQVRILAWTGFGLIWPVTLDIGMSQIPVNSFYLNIVNPEWTCLASKSEQ